MQAGMIEADTSNGLDTPLDEHLEIYAEAVEKRKEKISKVLRQAKSVMPMDATIAHASRANNPRAERLPSLGECKG